MHPRRLLPALALWLLAAACACAGPLDAVVRVTSHGGSGVVIQTAPGRSLILTCGHLFTDHRTDQPSPAELRKPLVLDMPNPSPTAPLRATSRVLAMDCRLDLALVELTDGPLPYVCPVAPAGFRPARLVSAGYDSMKWPARRDPASVVYQDYSRTYTREAPWPGRSGGGLIDPDAGLLVGVVHGFECTPRGQFRPGVDRGLYVSHQAVRDFLARCSSPGIPAARPDARGRAAPPFLPEAPVPAQPYRPAPLCLPGAG